MQTASKLNRENNKEKQKQQKNRKLKPKKINANKKKKTTSGKFVYPTNVNKLKHAEI